MEQDREAYSADATTVLDRRVLTSRDEILAGATEVVQMASRELCIFSHELAGPVFADASIIEGVRQLAISGPHARVRVLVSFPSAAARNAPQLLTLIRQLSSHIGIRSVGPQHRHQSVTFIIADDRAVIYHPVEENSETLLEKIPGTARHYLNLFNEMWEHGGGHPDLRSMTI